MLFVCLLYRFMRNITGHTSLPASDYAESGCKGTKKIRNGQTFLQLFALEQKCLSETNRHIDI